MDSESFRWVVSGLLIVIAGMFGLFYHDFASRIKRLEKVVTLAITSIFGLEIGFHPEHAEKLAKMLKEVLTINGGMPS